MVDLKEKRIDRILRKDWLAHHGGLIPKRLWTYHKPHYLKNE
jgi:hypothetical protein